MIRLPLRFLASFLLGAGLAAAAGEAKKDIEAAHLDFANAVLARQRGNRDEAEKGFEKARQEDPDALPLVNMGVSIRMAHDDLPGATRLYKELAERHPEKTGYQLQYASFLRDNAPGDDFVARESTAILEAAHKRDPRALGVIELLFRLYEQREKREQSRALYEQLVAAPEPSPGAVLMAARLAKTLLSASDKEARQRLNELFRKTLERDPDNASFARAASDNFRDQKMLPDAIAMLRLHTAANPQSLELRTRLGILLLAAGQEEEGEKQLLEVISIYPQQGLAQQSLAKLYRQQEKVEEALPHAAEALKVRGGSPGDFVDLADEFLEAQRPRDARLLLEKAVYFNPDNAELAAKLAIAARRDPETRDKSSLLFREAEQLSGDGNGPAAEPDFLLESAGALIDGAQLPAAEERLRRAIRAFPAERKKETAAAMRQLAGLWKQQGKNAEAAASLLKRADSLAPQP